MAKRKQKPLPQQIVPPTEIVNVSEEQTSTPLAFTKVQIGLIAAILVLFFGMLIGSLYYFTRPVAPIFNGIRDAVSLNGSVDINGVIPEGSTVTIRAREINEASTSANIRATDITAKDLGVWEISGAVNGKSYEVYARLMNNGNIIAQSDPVFMSAPAQKEVLRINIVPQVQPQVATGSAIISGTIQTNGYIPADSTIRVEGKKLGATVFTTIAANLPALKTQFMNYATAIEGQSYEVRGSLINNGRIIGTSNTIVLTAPAQNEVLEINSTAQAPAPTPAPSNNPITTTTDSGKTISGYINLNGAVPQGATMVIIARASGTTDFQVVQDSISPKDDATWSWNGGDHGKSYDLKAVLKKPNGDGTFSDVSTSNQITVTAPAENQQLSLNSSFLLPPPLGGRIALLCRTKNAATNQWDVTLNYNSIDQANAYWFQVGTTPGGSDFVNIALPTTGTALQTTNVTLNDSVTYYARYAYSYNGNASTNNPSDFSPFSSGTSFKCPK